METRARYVLVGIFSLISLLAALGFILWLAKVELDRTYAQYDILFDTVAGLGKASAVRYNGVDVGTVLDFALDREDSSVVRVRIEVFASTPIRTDTIATLASQGVTGVSFVALEGGNPNSDRLVRVPPANVPVIRSQPSVVQGLLVSAPELLAEAQLLMRDIRGFTTNENGQAIAGILANVESATARVDELANRTESFLASAETTLTEAQDALVEIKSTFQSANTLMKDDVPDMIVKLSAAVDSVKGSVAGFESFSQNGLPQFTALAQDARNAIAKLSALTDRISRDPARFFLGNQTPSYRN